MDVITCGEALWISCGSWLGFWNGSIGALTSALLAAGVATGVVLATNRKQSQLARIALDAQSESLQEQLNEQRREGSRHRELAAIAELVAETHALWWRPELIWVDSGNPFPRALAAAIRWRLEGTLGETGKVEQRVLTIGQAAAHTAVAEDKKHAAKEGLKGILTELVKDLASFAAAWPHLCANDQETELNKLAARDAELMAKITELSAEFVSA
ncbi:hypothetical protein LRQ04_00145 [Paenarthrobacter sp. AR 02]|uniref:hypothetical protein n=1 Tax=Paenarthrobacter sp. AR 02 TaxID=2899821 RepID=UPI001F43E443|nr:hypothetical protein [Paenarthrobacter sp. AR 02]MCF3137652.1 hypothetical protein [Paenarthrobacter sp. AR 02]